MNGISSRMKLFVKQYQSEYNKMKQEITELRERNQYLEEMLAYEKLNKTVT